MKSTRRHELQHNVLDAELAKVIGFFRRWGTHMAWGVLIAALVVFVAVYVHNRSQRRSHELQVEYDQLVMRVDPDMKLGDRLQRLAALADQDDNEHIAALACVEIGDAYSRRMLIEMATPTDAEQRSSGEDARSRYGRVIDSFPTQRMAVAKAYFGLGKLEESYRNFEAARAAYQAVLQMTDMSGYVVSLAAERALAELDVISKPVAMATTRPSRPTTMPAETATTKPLTPTTQPK